MFSSKKCEFDLCAALYCFSDSLCRKINMAEDQLNIQEWHAFLRITPSEMCSCPNT